ncbi:hypothetical protein cypCar_00038721 [Cyprinus carpio]|nr:hypothetical protein cypCar_00038721 [Cyprinus carpio]
MKELRQGVKLKKVEEQPFNSMPTEFSLTPFEMLMQDIRSCKYKLRKVVVDGNIPMCVKRNAHELILDFIRSRPPLKPRQQSLHDRVLAEIRQDHKLRPVEPSSSKRSFGSLPCLAHTCQCDIKSPSCIDLSITGARSRPPSCIRVLLKAPTLAEMEEMSIFEDEDSPDGMDIRRVESSPTPLKRDRSFSEHDLDELRGEVMSESPPLTGERPRSHTLTGVGPPHIYQGILNLFLSKYMFIFSLELDVFVVSKDPFFHPKFLLLLEQGERSLEDHTRLFLALAELTIYPDDTLCAFYDANLNTACSVPSSEDGPRAEFAAIVEWTLARNATKEKGVDGVSAERSSAPCTMAEGTRVYIEYGVVKVPKQRGEGSSPRIQSKAPSSVYSDKAPSCSRLQPRGGSQSRVTLNAHPLLPPPLLSSGSPFVHPQPTIYAVRAPWDSHPPASLWLEFALDSASSL